MRKSNKITLVLLSAALACNSPVSYKKEITYDTIHLVDHDSVIIQRVWIVHPAGEKELEYEGPPMEESSVDQEEIESTSTDQE